MSISASDIRPFRPADLDRVMVIEQASYSHPWTREMFIEETRNPFSSLEVVWLEEDVAGYLCSWFFAGELHILNIATEPRFRRRGVAAALLRHSIDRSRSQGVARAFLEVRVSNEGAISLYQHFGFRPLHRRRAYYPDGEDALVMEWLPAAGAPEVLSEERKDV